MRQPLDFDRMIEEGAALWRVGAAAVDSVERQVADAVANGPAALTTCAVTAFAFVRAKQEELQICLRDRYGIVLDDFLEHGPRIQIVDKERAQPRDGFDIAQGLNTLIRLMTYNAAQWAMSSARREAGADYWAREVQAHWWAKKYRVTIPRLPRHHQASAALAAYLRVMRNAPILYAPFAQRGEGPPLGHRLEEAALGGLSAWVRSRTKTYESIRTALAAVGEPQEVLLRELPGAVLTELADLDAAASDPERFAALLSEVSEREVDRYLTNRVTARLRAAGKDIERSSHLAGQLEGTDRDIENFVQREEVRQQLDALEVGDVITAVDGKSVEDVDDFREAMGKADGDEPVKVTVPNRKGPQPVSIAPRSGKGDDLGIRVPVNDPVPEEGDPRTPDGKPDGPQEPDDEPDGPQPQGLKNAEPTYAPARVPESKAPEPPSGADASVEQYSAED